MENAVRFGLIVATVAGVIAGCGDTSKPSNDAGSTAPDATTDATDATEIEFDTSDGGRDAPEDSADVEHDADADDADVADGRVETRPHCRSTGVVQVWTDASLLADCGNGGLHLRALETGVELAYWAESENPPPESVVSSLRPAADAVLTLDGVMAQVCADDYVATLDRSSCDVEVRDRGGRALLAIADEDVWHEDGRSGLRFATPATERWFGCGENTGTLDRRATEMIYWNTDAYNADFGGYAPGAGPLYLSLPMCVGIDGNGVRAFFVDQTHRVEVDIATDDPGHVVLRTAADFVRIHAIVGPDVEGVMRNHARLVGFPALPPRWALGFHQSRWGYNDAQAFRDVAREFRSRALPADVLWFDIQHMDGFRTFTWDSARFGDVAALLDDLEGHGFRSVMIADPGIKVDEAWPLYREARDARHFLQWPDGTDFVGFAWPGESSFPDFTFEGAAAWWAENIARSANLGVDGIWLDVNEPTTFPEGGGGNTVDNAVLARGLRGVGSTMAEVHNLYGSLEAEATWMGLLQARPDERPFVLSRAGFSGLQQWAGVWTGDAPSTWHALGETLAMVVNIGLSGVTMVGSDVGGYSGGATPELYARWFQLGFLSPFFRAHVTNGVAGQEPWQFGTEVTDIARYWLQMRSALMPLFYSLAWQASQTGMPLLRLPSTAEGGIVADADDEVMLGPWLLAAPVLTQGATNREIRLPEAGAPWLDYRSGAAWEAGALERVVTLADLPIFVRPGAIIPRRDAMLHEGERPVERLYIDLWPHPLRATTFEIFDDDGTSRLELGNWAVTTVTLEAGAEAVTVEGARRGTFDVEYDAIELRWLRIDTHPSRVELDGIALPEAASLDELRDAASAWYHDPNARQLHVSFGERANWSITAHYDTALDELRPSVDVAMAVSVPPETDVGTPIHVAGDFNDWTHEPFGTVGADGIARGLITVPRGAWYFFKFTRGNWETVEKYPGCEEARNRYAFGEPGARTETVWQWRDLCE